MSRPAPMRVSSPLPLWPSRAHLHSRPPLSLPRYTASLKLHRGPWLLAPSALATLPPLTLRYRKTLLTLGSRPQSVPPQQWRLRPIRPAPHLQLPTTQETLTALALCWLHLLRPLMTLLAPPSRLPRTLLWRTAPLKPLRPPSLLRATPRACTPMLQEELELEAPMRSCQILPRRHLVAGFP